MPIFFQQQINQSTRIGIWDIKETEDFFISDVPLQQSVSHPHKRLQHLAGRFLLRYLFADFPNQLIEITNTGKPFLPNAEYQFSLSHCGHFAAAIVSKKNSVGVDVEEIKPLVGKLIPKFLSAEEQQLVAADSNLKYATISWSAKEAIFKWYGLGKVSFREHIQLLQLDKQRQELHCLLKKNESDLIVHYRQFNALILTWVIN